MKEIKAKSCANCHWARVDVSGDNWHEPMTEEMYCGVNNDYVGTGDFVNITDEEWDEWLTVNPYACGDQELIASRCSEYIEAQLTEIDSDPTE